MAIDFGTTQTTVIKTIAIGAASETLPTAPYLGNTYSWSTDEDWDAIGFKPSADDFEFNDADGNVIQVKAPGDLQKQLNVHVTEPNILDNIVIKTYEIGSKVLDVVSNWSETSDVYSPTATITEYSVILEYEGLGWLHIPRCEIMAGAPGGGRAGLGSQSVTIDILATTAVPAGYQWIQFVAEPE